MIRYHGRKKEDVRPTVLHRRLPVLIALVLLAACSAGQRVTLATGEPAPAFDSQRLDGTPMRFPADLTGRPVVIRFWADWCRYCEGEMRDIDAVLRRHPDSAIVVLAVNAGQDRTTAAAFVAKLGIGYPALLDEDAQIARRYGVAGLPTTFFVGRDGRVAAKQVGEMSAAAFEQKFLALSR
jgi:peroxiredoxin